jgi:tRNA (cmo5U34)-methyltransferase
MKNGKANNIYAENNSTASEFVFNDEVAEVFPDMIQRSVPGYAQTLDIIEVAAATFAVPNTNCYDLGCSLGAGALRMEKATSGKKCDIIAVDNSKPMIERLSENLRELPFETRIQPIFADLLDLRISNASFAAMSYTLQFIPLERRLELLKTVRSAMIPGAAFVLSEKVAFESQAESQIMNTLHLEFKRLNGYSELEIARKRAALENVLVPETVETHLDRLASVGFSEVYLAMRHLNFATFIAVN